MRKADYATLARIIRGHVAAGRAGAAVAHFSDVERATLRQTLQTAADIAREFASSASVDKAAFLKACGIE